MVNKKKRDTENVSNQSHHYYPPVRSMNSEAAMVETNNQLNQPGEIKEEPHTKVELQSVGELVDVPAWDNGVNNLSTAGANQSNGEYDFGNNDFDEVKIKVEKEVDKKKEEKPRYNAESADLHQSAQQNEDNFMTPENSHGAKNSKACSKVPDPKNVSKKHKCDVCEYSARDKWGLNRHSLKHTGEKQHGCNFCLKQFKSTQHLRTHMKVHVKEFLFVCLGCLQGFNVEDEKNKHENSCTIRRYECHLCKESFGSKKINMIRHICVHSGTKPFECKQCFKQFARKGSLNRHIKLHAGPRSFRCSKCRDGFSQREERNAHEEKCNCRVYECYDCRKSFGSRKSHLIRHMRTHSDESEFACHRCAKQFKHKYTLNNHMKTHTMTLPFKCLICRRGFLKDDKRKVHQRNCKRRYYECHMCKKFFNLCFVQLKGHMHAHSGEKRFQCELCCKQFTQKSNLKKHMKIIHDKKY